MNIVWLSWKDSAHPDRGGAEVVTHEIIGRFLRDGHKVTLLTALYSGAKEHEVLSSGLEIYRTGNRYTVYLKARSLFRDICSQNKVDIVIDEMNTIPFRPPRGNYRLVLFYHQLARVVWFYQMVFPLSLVGYLLEPLVLFSLRHHYDKRITVSRSSQMDIMRYGVRDIDIIREGISVRPTRSLSRRNRTNIIIHGAVRPMKRTLHGVMAFEAARDLNPSLTLTVSGDTSSAYAKKVLRYIEKSRHSSAIEVLGRVSDRQRRSIMQKAAVILVTSVKEGWGLIVTEANSQGVPAIAYDVDGLRDSVRSGESGILTSSGSPRDMGLAIVKLLADKDTYEGMQKFAWHWSKDFTFENTYRDFLGVVSSVGTTNEA